MLIGVETSNYPRDSVKNRRVKMLVAPPWPAWWWLHPRGQHDGGSANEASMMVAAPPWPAGWWLRPRGQHDGGCAPVASM